MVVGVLVQLQVQNIDKVFDYNVPKELTGNIKMGIRVEVPFGHQTLEGFVLEIKDLNEKKLELKDILSIVDKDIVLNEELLSLGQYMKEKTLATLISCYQVMLPKALKAKKGTTVNKRFDTYYKIKQILDIKYNDKQQAILALFKDKEEIKKDMLESISVSSLKTLVKKGILEEIKKECYRLEYQEEEFHKYPLTKDQQTVVEMVDCSKYNKPYLLWGVTGSGKTEVYMELIEKALKYEKNSIMLVPEISLTPQMVERFTKRFGKQIAALHSALSDGEKYDEWRRIARGEASIVIGARSAIFAPLQNIGMIIIDEEHSDSYKQDNNPRYSAIDMAMKRAEVNNCPIIMGSATPSLEVFARAQKEVYQLLKLPNRVNGKALPAVKIIDMSQEAKKTSFHITLELLKEIKSRIENAEQIILLLNRRGYSSFVSCKNCGETIKCPHCDITLTYHKTSNMLRCHYCGYATNLVKACPSCKEEGLSTLGVGTEKIEEELKQLIPDARVLRMDYDTTSRKGAHQRMITDFKDHKYDILLGTQIVAKGLDFNNVTLVGVINADTSLNIPDFRSSEVTFSLLSQAAGRSGRSEKTGEVIIQTYNPDHYAIEHTKKHDYYSFYLDEMKIRQQLKYPPFYFITYVRISSKDYDFVSKEANKIKKTLDHYLMNSIILGPSTCNVFKMNNVYRYGIIIKYKQEPELISTLEKLINHYKGNNKITVDIDFNPSHL